METSDGHVSSTNHIPRLLDHRGIRTIYRILNRHWASLLFIGAMALSIWASWISWNTSQEVKNVQHKNCANQVMARDDFRAFLKDVLQVATSDIGREFIQRELDEKYPPAFCTDNNVFTPIRP